MNVQGELRSGKDRRDDNLTSFRAIECRTGVDRRDPEMLGGNRLDYSRVVADGFWGESEDDPARE